MKSWVVVMRMLFVWVKKQRSGIEVGGVQLLGVVGGNAGVSLICRSRSFYSLLVWTIMV